MKTSEIQIYRLLTHLESYSKSRVIWGALVITAALGWVDYKTGFDLSFSFFYLLPISMTAWAVSRKAGLAISVFSAAVWLTSNMLSGQIYTNPAIGVWNTLLRFGFYGVVTVLLTELHVLLEEERILANTDPLTGALNRRSFYAVAEKRMIISEVSKHPYTVVYIDLDNFKKVNDSLGHTAGDNVLQSVVNAIQTQIRSSDYLARLGGDEFSILLTDIDQEQAKPIVERIQSSLLDAMKVNNWPITFSIGVLTVLIMPESVDKLVSLTDTLMYEVKSKGKNAIHYSIYE